MAETAMLRETYEETEYEPADLSGASPEVQSLTRYLNDIGRTPLLTRELELDLTAGFRDARETMLALLRGLPPAARRFALEGRQDELDDPGDVSLATLEELHRRLIQYVLVHGDARVDRVVQETRPLLRKMERVRDDVVAANLRLVVHVVKQYCSSRIPDMDMIQEGNLGLMRAVEKFDPARGHRFATYAFWWIKQAVVKSQLDRSRMIRIPAHLHDSVSRIQKAWRELGEELGRDPTHAELARQARMPLKKLEQTLRLLQGN